MMNVEECIVDYLLGNLSEEDKTLFESELVHNENLRNEVELQRLLMIEIQAVNAVRDAEVACKEQRQKTNRPKVVLSTFKRIASIAACVIICIGGYNIWLRQYTVNVGQELYVVSRSSDDVTYFIENKQYDRALGVLEQEISELDKIMEKVNSQVLFERREDLMIEKANVYLLKGDRALALKTLRGITNPKASEMIERLYWYSPISNLFTK